MKRLSEAEISRMFGVFEYSDLGDGRIEIDPVWVSENIVALSLPIVGGISCHRLVSGQLEAAFAELERRGLAGLIDVDDFRHSGGCFVPRHTKRLGGAYSESLSRHSFGVALDINPSAYPYGSGKQQPAALREIFSKWGFEVVVAKDPMHFEFVRFVPSSAEEDDEDMACAFRAFQAEKPEKEFFIDGLFTGKNDFGKGRVFLAMRVEKGEHYPAAEGDAKVKVYVIPQDPSKPIDAHSFERTISADNCPVTVELPEIGGFSLHLLVEEGSPILCAVNQHYSG